jgi:hypothetical protein
VILLSGAGVRGRCTAPWARCASASLRIQGGLRLGDMVYAGEGKTGRAPRCCLSIPRTVSPPACRPRQCTGALADIGLTLRLDAEPELAMSSRRAVTAAASIAGELTRLLTDAALVSRASAAASILPPNQAATRWDLRRRRRVTSAVIVDAHHPGCRQRLGEGCAAWQPQTPSHAAARTSAPPEGRRLCGCR